MVFTEVGGTTLLFDKQMFLAKTREQLLTVMPEPKAISHMNAFIYELRTGQLHHHNVEMFEFVSRLMYDKVGRNEVGLNSDTKYAYEGANDVNDVLEDCLTAVSSNSRCVWATGKPIMNDNSNMAITVQEIRPLSWLQRKLNVQPSIVRDTTFESGKTTRITGTCKSAVITVAEHDLEIHTRGFRWLR